MSTAKQEFTITVAVMATYDGAGIKTGASKSIVDVYTLPKGSGGGGGYSDVSLLGGRGTGNSAWYQITPTNDGGWDVTVCVSADWANSISVSPGASVAYAGTKIPGQGTPKTCNTGHVSAPGTGGPGTGIGGGSGTPPNGLTNGDLQVQINDHDTNKPIQGASVQIQDATGTTTLATESTDAQGQCYFSGLTPADYNINATAQGYLSNGVSLHYIGGVNGQTLTLLLTATGGPGPGINPCGSQPVFPGNPLQWPQYIGDSVQWLACQIWQYLILQMDQVAAKLWAALPGWLQSGISNLDKAMIQFTAWITDPTAWLRSAGKGILSEKSPSLMEKGVAGVAPIIGKVAQALEDASYAKHPATDPIFGPIADLSNQLADLIATPTDTNGALDQQASLTTLAEKIAISIFVGQTAAENIPFLNKSGGINFALQYIEAHGILDVMRSYITPFLTHNLVRNVNYQLNGRYANVIPDLATLIELDRKGWVDPTYLATYGPLVSGISADKIKNMAKGQLAFPSLADFVIWNRRHPDQAFPLESVLEITGNEPSRYPEVFLERAHTDPSLIAVRTLARLGKLQTGDFESLVTRLGFRTDKLPGQTISDHDLMITYLQELAQPLLEKTYLASVERLYYQGKKTIDDLRTAAQATYPDPTELQTYLDTAANKLDAQVVKTKHFTYTELIKFAEAGVDVSKFVDADLALTGLDANHQAAIKAYIVAALAKKGLTL